MIYGVKQLFIWKTQVHPKVQYLELGKNELLPSSFWTVFLLIKTEIALGDSHAIYKPNKY